MRTKLGTDEDILDPCIDSVFKAIFTKDLEESRGSLRLFLSDILGKEVESVQVIPNELAVDSLDEKQCRFDVCVKFSTDKFGEIAGTADVEMTINPSSCELIRMEYNVGKLHSSQGIKGKYYRELHESYQISLLSKRNVFPKDNRIFHSSSYRDDETGESIAGLTHIITLELNKLGEILKKDPEEMTNTECWCVFFKCAKESDKREIINKILEIKGGIDMAAQVLSLVSRDEEERLRALSREIAVNDYYSGLAEAKYEGEQRGLQRGRQEGEQIGLQRGVNQEKARMIEHMRKSGMTVVDVSKFTGLSVDEINSLY